MYQTKKQTTQKRHYVCSPILVDNTKTRIKIHWKNMVRNGSYYSCIEYTVFQSFTLSIQQLFNPSILLCSFNPSISESFSPLLKHSCTQSFIHPYSTYLLQSQITNIDMNYSSWQTVSVGLSQSQTIITIMFRVGMLINNVITRVGCPSTTGKARLGCWSVAAQNV